MDSEPRPTGAQPPILVVDDEPAIRLVLGKLLRLHDHRVLEAASAAEALSHLETTRPAVALVDIVLPGMDGIELLGRIKRACPETEVIIMTSHASVETAVDAIRKGAMDYVHKPFEDLEQITGTVRKALAKRELALEKRALLETL